MEGMGQGVSHPLLGSSHAGADRLPGELDDETTEISGPGGAGRGIPEVTYEAAMLDDDRTRGAVGKHCSCAECDRTDKARSNGKRPGNRASRQATRQQQIQ